MTTAPTGGKPPAGYSYETLGGDVCKTCGCVVANEKIHATWHASLKPAPAVTWVTPVPPTSATGVSQ